MLLSLLKLFLKADPFIARTDRILERGNVIVEVNFILRDLVFEDRRGFDFLGVRRFGGIGDIRQFGNHPVILVHIIPGSVQTCPARAVISEFDRKRLSVFGERLEPIITEFSARVNGELRFDFFVRVGIGQRAEVRIKTGSDDQRSS